MKRYFILWLLAGYSLQSLYGQGSLQLTGGATLRTTGAASLVLDNTGWVNNGSFQQGSGGTISFTGTANADLSGSSPTTFERLRLLKGSGATLYLQQNIGITTALDLLGGLLNLGNHTVNLGATGTLFGESEASRVYTTGTGYIEATATLNAPAAVNPANLGAIISSADNLGPTTIRRGHASQIGLSGSGASLQRYYDILPASNTALNATLRFRYLDAELAGAGEAALSLWRSTNTGWADMGMTSRDQTANYVEKRNLQSLSRFTLAPGCATISVSIPDVNAVSPGGTEGTLYTGYGPTSLTLSPQVGGGVAPYTYQWTTGSPRGSVAGTTASLTVSPATTTTYYLQVSDAFGCRSEPVSKTVRVMDLRCGAKLDKLTVCVFQKGKYTTSCVAPKTVAGYLAAGSYLGECAVAAAATGRPASEIESPVITDRWMMTAVPNPSRQYFTVRLSGTGSTDRIRIRVVDLHGRIIEQKDDLTPGQSWHLGDNYRPGVYLLQLQQGSFRQTLKLLKLAN